MTSSTEKEQLPFNLQSINTRSVRDPPPSILQGIRNPYTSAHVITTEHAFVVILTRKYKSVSQGLTIINGSFYKKKSHPEHGYLSVVSVACCKVEVSATN